MPASCRTVFTNRVFPRLLIFHKPFGIVMSCIGVISLAKIIVNNNFVLFDTYRLLRRRSSNAVNTILLALVGMPPVIKAMSKTP